MTIRGQYALLAASILGASCPILGCKSMSVTRYVSPRITGRVVDAETHQPIQGVQVRRVNSEVEYRSTQPPKGGQLMAAAPVVRTQSDGTFILDSVKDLSFLRKPGWYSVNLAFQHPGYDRLRVSYSLADATNTVSGEPLIPDREVPLAPSKR